ncbi:MAG: alternative ribosome rescue aminoacyl-tRNA hydrolase ArfB [Pseudomonadota bacterium]
MIRINNKVTIHESELHFTYARSSGPGGQNVNKIESRVTLLFDVRESPSLAEEQKQLICARLSTRINKLGILRVVAQPHRSQAANRNAAIDRFVTILRNALKEKPQRKKTKTPRAQKKQRIQEKRYRGNLKKLRVRPSHHED